MARWRLKIEYWIGMMKLITNDTSDLQNENG